MAADITDEVTMAAIMIADLTDMASSAVVMKDADSAVAAMKAAAQYRTIAVDRTVEAVVLTVADRTAEAGEFPVAAMDRTVADRAEAKDTVVVVREADIAN
jgi:hypothetical protein